MPKTTTITEGIVNDLRNELDCVSFYDLSTLTGIPVNTLYRVNKGQCSTAIEKAIACLVKALKALPENKKKNIFLIK